MSHKTNKSLYSWITYLSPRLWLSVKWLSVKGTLCLLYIFLWCIIDRPRNLLWVVLVNWSHCIAVIQLPCQHATSSVLSSQMLTIGLGGVNPGIFILQLGIYKFYFYRGYTKSTPGGKSHLTLNIIAHQLVRQIIFFVSACIISIFQHNIIIPFEF